MGRTKKPIEPTDQAIHVYVGNKLLRALQAQADAEQRSLSYVTRRALTTELERCAALGAK